MTTLRERLTPQIIEDLKTRKRTNREVAAQLGVHEDYLSQVFNAKTHRERGKVALQREQTHELVEARRRMRLREAQKVVDGLKTLEKAAKTARCSERTMRRYVLELTQKDCP